jgi:hypothetical protein
MPAKRLGPVILAIFLALPLSMPPKAVWALQNVDMIVRFAAGLSENDVDGFLRDRDAEREGEITGLNIVFVNLPDGASVSDAIEEYRKDADVLYAEENFNNVKASLFPNENNTDEFDQQWGLNYETPLPAIGPSSLTGTEDTDISAPEGWNLSRGSSTTVIAVLDTGVEIEPDNHEDIQLNLWTNPGEIPDNNNDEDGNELDDDVFGWDFVNEDEDVDDDNVSADPALSSHGTHICGIIGADTNNGVGIAGINWNVQLMILKVLDANGDGTVANIIRAIEYAVDKGAVIINASWGLTSYSQALYDTIEEAGAQDVLVVTAAGNTATVEYPARFNLDNIIAVTATDFNNALADFGTGITAATDVEDVDLGAPGEDILSTFVTGNAPQPNAFGFEDYYWKSGTSQSAAFVTGVVGLLYSLDPGLSVEGLKARILSSAFDDEEPVPDLENSTVAGGRLDALETLNPTNIFIFPYGASVNFDADAPTDETVLFSLIGDVAVDWDTDCAREVGTIDATGLFTAEGPGTCNISATGLFTSASDIREVTVRIKEILVDPLEDTISGGGTIAFTATGGTAPYIWYSSNPEVASITRSGALEGVSSGSVTVTAIDAKGYFGVSDSITVARGKKSGNCFIATVAFGSPMAAQVRTLQAFRDRYLMTNPPGRAFVRLYYRVSPALADRIETRPTLRAAVRIGLAPCVLLASMMVKSGVSWVAVLLMLSGITAALAGWRIKAKRNVPHR